MRWDREYECEESRIMLIRNQESCLHVVDLESMEMRTCLVSVALSAGEKKQNQMFSRVDCMTVD